ncbi:hypothetical protein EVAR_63414_1 [Eumeta japonica]|uniref:Uncharacterized protein n=1 Tax=Eumeta variegata TaxID=151549 RepID=A0A4C1Z2M0_EUMVA|nr:hypothetical protein EVAR_63414_1 [Eumeta japonica]
MSISTAIPSGGPMVESDGKQTATHRPLGPNLDPAAESGAILNENCQMQMMGVSRQRKRDKSEDKEKAKQRDSSKPEPLQATFAHPY